MSGSETGALQPRDRNRILICDDDESIRNLFVMILTYGFPNVKRDLACNGREALSVFRIGHHGVILMDLRMPEMDGQQAFSEIQAMCNQYNWEMPPVVFLTGFPPPPAVNEIIGDGSYHCLLNKPVTSDQLMETVKKRL